MLSLPSPIHAINAQDGFSLMELMVAMLSGLVLTTASFALLQLATNQTSRATDYVQSSQLGRTAMSHIVDELNSGCVAEKTAPVRAGSTTEKLILVAAFSEANEVKPEEVQQHVISWAPNAASKNPEVGILSDEKALGTERVLNGEETEWVFSPKTVTTRFSEHIERATDEGEKELFKYYEYSPETKESATSGVTSLQEIKLKSKVALTKEQAAKVSAVTVSFTSLPTDNREELGRTDRLSSKVTFAFSAGFTEPVNTSKNPCVNP